MLPCYQGLFYKLKAEFGRDIKGHFFPEKIIKHGIMLYIVTDNTVMEYIYDYVLKCTELYPVPKIIFFCFNLLIYYLYFYEIFACTDVSFRMISFLGSVYMTFITRNELTPAVSFILGISCKQL